jgi:hypothetical protein
MLEIHVILKACISHVSFLYSINKKKYIFYMFKGYLPILHMNGMKSFLNWFIKKKFIINYITAVTWIIATYFVWSTRHMNYITSVTLIIPLLYDICKRQSLIYSLKGDGLVFITLMARATKRAMYVGIYIYIFFKCLSLYLNVLEAFDINMIITLNISNNPAFRKKKHKKIYMMVLKEESIK